MSERWKIQKRIANKAGLEAGEAVQVRLHKTPAATHTLKSSLVESLKTINCSLSNQKDQFSLFNLQTLQAVMSHQNLGMETSREAYAKAVELWKKDQSNAAARLARIQDTYQIDDVLEIIREGKEKYAERTGKSKARRWLGALSSQVMYYGQIMDTLSQHHSEYMPLAWGTMKILFIVSGYLAT